MRKLTTALMGIAGLVTLASPAAAAIWTFDDSGEPMTVGVTGANNGGAISCGNYGNSGENCLVNIYRPDATIDSILVPSGFAPQGNFYSTPVLEADGSLSDRLYVGGFGSNFQAYMFSDVDGGPQDFCFNDACSASYPEFAAIRETGGWQFHSQVNWSDGTSDTFYFKSDAGAPEPATWAMMVMGFGGLGAMLRRRLSFVAA